MSDPEILSVVLLLSLMSLSIVLVWAGQRRIRKVCDEGDMEVITRPMNTRPHLLDWEILTGLVMLLVLVGWASIQDIPLGPIANAKITPPIVKAPWFLVGIQEMLQHFDPWLAGVAIPAIFFSSLCLLPYLTSPFLDSGRGGRLILHVTGWVLVIMLGLWNIPMVVGIFFRGADWRFSLLWRMAAVSYDYGSPLPLTLGAKLGLGQCWASFLGAALCVLPFFSMIGIWPLIRRRSIISQLGFMRFLWSIFFLGGFAVIFVKLGLSLLFQFQYLWITPWFRV